MAVMRRGWWRITTVGGKLDPIWYKDGDASNKQAETLARDLGGHRRRNGAAIGELQKQKREREKLQLRAEGDMWRCKREVGERAGWCFEDIK
jgi:hypothetical protein